MNKDPYAQTIFICADPVSKFPLNTHSCAIHSVPCLFSLQGAITEELQHYNPSELKWGHCAALEHNDNRFFIILLHVVVLVFSLTAACPEAYNDGDLKYTCRHRTMVTEKPGSI